jgi:hypothetical protein
LHVTPVLFHFHRTDIRYILPVFLTYYCSGQAVPAVSISVAALVARLARYIQNGCESVNPATVARRETGNSGKA